MYCSNCGNKIGDEARFCSFCGTKVAVLSVQDELPSVDQIQPAVEVTPEPVAPQIEPAVEPEAFVQPEPEITPVAVEAEPVPDTMFDEFQWNVSEYPTRGAVEKTEDVNFDWNADPSTIFTGKGMNDRTAAEIKVKADMMDAGEPVVTSQNSAAEAVGRIDTGRTSAAIDEFYTINRKNEEFQQLLNKEYEKVKSGNTIGDELNAAEQLTQEKFDARPEDMSMEAFLEREGIEKPYEPKAFETDVLKKIDAQERAKERKRLEEEAREKALEEARQEALAKKREEAKRAVEEAEAKKAEAAAEAQRKAVQEAQAKAIEEARIKAEQEAAQNRAVEEARAKAQAEYQAAQEAEKIRQQREARVAAEEAARAKAEEERRRLEEERLKSKLEKEREELSRKAESAAAAEEARKVLEHTTRMREEEAAKIKAAIAGLRGEMQKVADPAEAIQSAASSISNIAEPAAEAPAPVVEVPPVVNPVAAAEPAPAPETVAPVPVQNVQMAEPEEKVENVDLMDLFPENYNQEPAAADFSHTQKIPEVSQEIKDAHQATKEQINDMAKARDTYFATFYGEESESLENQIIKEEAKQQVAAELAQAQPEQVAPVAPAPAVTPVVTEAPASSADDLTKTRVIDKSAVLAGLETTRRISKAELRAQEDKAFFDSLESAETPVSPETQDAANTLVFKDNAQTVDELLQQFDHADAAGNDVNTDPILASLPDDAETEVPSDGVISEGFVAKEEPTVVPDAATMMANPGLTDTMIMPGREVESSITEDFDNYGVEEAENYKRQQEMVAAQAAQQTVPAQGIPQVAPETVENPMVQQPVNEADYDDDYDDEEEKSGGIGHVILKIILIILIVIFAAELVGMAIKFMAPNSGAAELIDSQLEKIIGLITG